MPRYVHEAEPLCQDCAHHCPVKRGLAEFPDGKTYVQTGTCENPQSKLHKRQLTGSMTASMNGFHNAVNNLTDRLVCFKAK